MWFFCWRLSWFSPPVGLQSWYNIVFTVYFALFLRCNYLNFSFFNQIIIFGHVTRLISNNGFMKLLVVRLGITNSIVDPWIYILLRKENFVFADRHLGIICFKISFVSDSTGPNVTPLSEERHKKMDNTLSSGKTLSTDDLNV